MALTEASTRRRAVAVGRLTAVPVGAITARESFTITSRERRVVVDTDLKRADHALVTRFTARW